MAVSPAATVASPCEWIAPEVRTQGLGIADQRSDVFALCATLRLLFGKFNDDDAVFAHEALVAGIADKSDQRPNLTELADNVEGKQQTAPSRSALPSVRVWSEGLEVPAWFKSHWQRVAGGFSCPLSPGFVGESNGSARLKPIGIERSVLRCRSRWPTRSHFVTGRLSGTALAAGFSHGKSTHDTPRHRWLAPFRSKKAPPRNWTVAGSASSLIATSPHCRRSGSSKTAVPTTLARPSNKSNAVMPRS